MTVADSPDWSNPGGGPPGQLLYNTLGSTGVVAAGTDGVNALPLATNDLGMLVPMVPQSSSGIIAVGTSLTQLLAASTSPNCKFLFALDIISTVAGHQTGHLEIATQPFCIWSFEGPGFISIPLHGYKAFQVVSAIASATGFSVMIRTGYGPA